MTMIPSERALHATSFLENCVCEPVKLATPGHYRAIPVLDDVLQSGLGNSDIYAHSRQDLYPSFRSVSDPLRGLSASTSRDSDRSLLPQFDHPFLFVPSSGSCCLSPNALPCRLSV